MKRKDKHIPGPIPSPCDSGMARAPFPPKSAIIAAYLQKLRARLEAGTYPVDPLAVAEMIVSRDYQQDSPPIAPVASLACPHADAVAIHAEVLAIVAGACAELPHIEALVLQLAVIEELNSAEIAVVIDEPAAYVASLRKIALGRLRLRIGDVIG